MLTGYLMNFSTVSIYLNYVYAEEHKKLVNLFDIL